MAEKPAPAAAGKAPASDSPMAGCTKPTKTLADINRQSAALRAAGEPKR